MVAAVVPVALIVAALVPVAVAPVAGTPLLDDWVPDEQAASARTTMMARLASLIPLKGIRKDFSRIGFPPVTIVDVSDILSPLMQEYTHLFQELIKGN
jgi:hypothetical protein